MKCPHCGGDLEYQPGQKTVRCKFCDSVISIDDIEKEKKVNAQEHTESSEESEQRDNSKFYDATVFTCPQCGGELYSTTETAVTFCPYCSSQVTLKSRIEKQKAPDLILPFKVTREECEKLYKKKINSAIFAPSEMKKDVVIEKFRGIYMPYWVYDTEKNNGITVHGSKSYRKGDYIYTDHYNLTVNDMDVSCSGLAYDAASVFYDELSMGIAPFDMRESENFKTAYMEGFYADAGDVDSEVYKDDAEEIGKLYAASKIAENYHEIGSYGASQAKIAEDMRLTSVKERFAYLPVWFLSIRNKKQDRVAYAVVNGQTGKVASDIPISILKFLVGTVILAAVIFLILTRFTFTPTVMIVAACIIALLAVIVANSKINNAFRRENYLNDEGIMSVRNDATRNAAADRKRESAAERSQKLSTGFFVFGIAAVIVITLFFYFMFDSYIPGLFIGIIGFGIYTIVKKVTDNKAPTFNEKSTEKAPASEKMKLLWKPLAGLLPCIVVWIIHPVQDYYYYGAAIVSILLTCWCFINILQKHNEMTLRKLPQMNKRGGDENA